MRVLVELAILVVTLDVPPARAQGGGAKVPDYVPPTVSSTVEPTGQPTVAPVATTEPTVVPTAMPTFVPTTAKPTIAPTTAMPTIAPTFLTQEEPVIVPSLSPSVMALVEETPEPSIAPTTDSPTSLPTSFPTNQGKPSVVPTFLTEEEVSSANPSNSPVASTMQPSITMSTPSFRPTRTTTSPTRSLEPSLAPSISLQPTVRRTAWPTRTPPPPTNRGGIDNDDDDDDTNNAGVFVAVMAILFVIALCCGYNRGKVQVDNFQDAETAVQEFKDDLLKRRFLVFTTPAGSLTCCSSSSCGCCGGQKETAATTSITADSNKPKQRPWLTWKKRTTALFFSTRIKRRWKPSLTYCQFFFGWVAFFSTIIGFFAPEHRGNSIVGCGALFINELLLHLWYGYLRYPNMVTGGANGDDDDGFFEDIKTLFSILYHQDTEDHSEKWVEWVCFPFTMVLHAGTLFGICATHLGCCVLRMAAAGGDDSSSSKRRRNSNHYDEDDAATDHALALLIGALVGSFAYPLLFLVAQKPGWKFVAAYAHHIVEEYYEAKLFGKSGKEFLLKVAFSVLGDMVGIDGLEGIDEAIEEAVEEEKPDISSDDLDSQRIDKDNQGDYPEKGRLLLTDSTERTMTARDEETDAGNLALLETGQIPSSRIESDEEDIIVMNIDTNPAAVVSTSSASSSSSLSTLSSNDSDASSASSDDSDSDKVSSSGWESTSTSSSRHWETDDHAEVSIASSATSSDAPPPQWEKDDFSDDGGNDSSHEITYPVEVTDAPPAKDTPSSDSLFKKTEQGKGAESSTIAYC